MERDCGICNGEGKLYTSRYGGNDPDVWCIGKCEDCSGTGRETIKCECCQDDAVVEHHDREHRVLFFCAVCRDDWMANEAEEIREDHHD